MTEDRWNQMMAVLAAMKPGLVAKPLAPSADPSLATDPEDALRRATPGPEFFRIQGAKAKQPE
jgi:hypothetical protein